MAFAGTVVVLDLTEAAVIAALLGRDEQARRERLAGTTDRTRAHGLAAIEAIENGSRAWQAQMQRGHSDVRANANPSSSPRDDECTTTEAAQLTGLCERQVRRLASQLGRKVGGRWQLSRSEVLAFVEARDDRRTA